MATNLPKAAKVSKDIGILLKKTYVFFRKFKWPILISSAILSIAAVWGASKILIDTYNAKSVLKVEITDSNSPSSRINRYKAMSLVGTLTTRSFLGQVVDSMKLQYMLQGSGYFRKDVFESIDYDDVKQYGNYKIVYKADANHLTVYYSNPSGEIENRIVYDGSLPPSREISYNNIRVKLNESLFTAGKDLSINTVFYKRNGRISKLKKSIQPALTVQQQFIEISYSDTDRYLARDVTNAITELFIKENVRLKTFKTKKLIENLENQLSIAQEKLSTAEQALEDFREKHPRVLLSGGALAEVTTINSEQARMMENKRSMDQIKRSLARLQQQTNLDQKTLTAKELLSLASGLGYSSASVLLEKINSETLNLEQLQESYPADHPVVSDVIERLNLLVTDVKNLGNSIIGDFEKNIQGSARQIAQTEQKLKTLPKDELALAKYTREKDIAEHTYTALKRQYNSARVKERTESPDAFVLDHAILPSAHNPFMNVLIKGGIGLVLFIFLPVFFSFAGAYLDPTVHFKEELEENFPGEVLGSIPVIGHVERIPKQITGTDKRKVDPKLTTIDYSPSHINESFRNLRSSIMYKMDYLKQEKVLLITSDVSGEGKSLVAANLAVTFAQNKIPTLLIDGDLRRGVLHNSLVCEKAPGLSDLLSSPVDVSEKIIQKLLQKTQVPNLFLLSSGSLLPNPSELLNSKKMGDVLELARKKFGIVIIDSSPMGLTSDAMNIVKYVDGALLVAMSEKTRMTKIYQNYNKLNVVTKNRVLGVVINGVNESLMKNEYTYSYYNY